MCMYYTKELKGFENWFIRVYYMHELDIGIAIPTSSHLYLEKKPGLR